MAATFLTARRPPRVRGGRALAPGGNLRRISPAPRARSTRGCVLRPRAKTTTPAPPGCSAETMRAAGANGCVSPNPARRVLDHLGGVACVVVHRQVQPSVATVGPTQPIEQFEEQLLVLALSYHPVKATRFRKLSAPEIHTFRLVPGVFSGRRSPLRIQQKPTLGFVSSLVSSWKNDPASLSIERISKSHLMRRVYLRWTRPRLAGRFRVTGRR